MAVPNPEIFFNGRVALHLGDCLDVLALIEENSIDSCVTDPPYHLVSIVKRFSRATPDDVYRNAELRKTFNQGGSPYARQAKGFMGKQWDGGDIAFRPEIWAQVWRVLKPGAHLVAFGGSRTYHRLACAVEDAGFEIRDQIGWVYGSGFPKSLDVSKAIDKAAGVEFEASPASGVGFMGPDRPGGYNRTIHQLSRVGKSTDAAKQWAGFGTALKPAWEPIVLARKPLIGTVTQNVLAHGTGALNIDGCRIGTEVETWPKSRSFQSGIGKGYTDGLEAGITQSTGVSPPGRWPANIVHDGSEEVLAAFPETAPSTDAVRVNRVETQYGFGNGKPDGRLSTGHNDSGSAARFFYQAKADSDERIGSRHPTVKPVDLMQWLVRLVTPPGGVVLDPFAGTGTTGEAAFREGFRAILIEREAEYQADIRRRMALALAGPDERQRESIKARGLVADAGPLFERPYNGEDDFAKSIDDAYAAVRDRKDNGGPGWTPK